MSANSQEFVSVSTVEPMFYRPMFYRASIMTKHASTASNVTLGYEPYTNVTGVSDPSVGTQPWRTTGVTTATYVTPIGPPMDTITVSAGMETITGNISASMQLMGSNSVWIGPHLSGTELDELPSNLTEEELSDIHRGLEEIRSGKAKHFNNVRETIEWLHRKRI